MRQTVKPTEKTSGRYLLPFFLCAFAFAIWLASDRIMEINDSDLPSAGRYTFRIVSTLTFFIVALLARRKNIDLRRLLGLAVVLEGGALISLAVLAAAHPTSTTLVLLTQNLTAAVEGIGGSLALLVFFCALASLNYRWAFVGIPAIYALAHALYLLLLIMPMASYELLRSAMIILSLVIIAPLLFGSRWQTFAPNPAEPAAQPKTIAFSLKGCLSRDPFVFTGVFAFALLYNLVTEIGISRQEYSTFFGTEATEAVTLLIIAALALLVFVKQTRINIEFAFILVAFFLATALLLLPLLWDSSTIIPWHIVKFAALVFAVIARAHFAFRSGGSSQTALVLLGFCLGIGQLAFLPGYLFGVALRSSHMTSTTMAFGISVGLFWIFTVLVLIAFWRNKQAQLKRQSEHIGTAGVSAFEAGCKILVEQTGLTDREQEVLLAFAHGRSAQRIAQDLYLSNATVKTYLQRIYTKTDVHSRQQLLDLIDSQTR
jgi:DNA-binding CsgD family transcriptional regulator